MPPRTDGRAPAVSGATTKFLRSVKLQARRQIPVGRPGGSRGQASSQGPYGVGHCVRLARPSVTACVQHGGTHPGAGCARFGSSHPHGPVASPAMTSPSPDGERDDLFDYLRQNSLLGREREQVWLDDLIRLDREVGLTSISRRVARMQDNVETDPAAAIGAAKELLEAVCYKILGDRDVEYKKTDPTIPDLIKWTTQALSLRVQDITAESAETVARLKATLSALGQLAQGLAEMRNYMGTGHGTPDDRNPLERHARLAAGASATLASFLWDEHVFQQQAVSIGAPALLAQAAASAPEVGIEPSLLAVWTERLPAPAPGTAVLVYLRKHLVGGQFVPVQEISDRTNLSAREVLDVLRGLHESGMVEGEHVAEEDAPVLVTSMTDEGKKLARRSQVIRVRDLVSWIDSGLDRVVAGVPRDSSEELKGALIQYLRDAFEELRDDHLAHPELLPRWGELRRHLSWGQGKDWHDIASMDWPSMRLRLLADLEKFEKGPTA